MTRGVIPYPLLNGVISVMENVFVYGTLQKGMGNHRILSSSPFVGNYMTTIYHSMFMSGNVPFVLSSLIETRKFADLLSKDDAKLIHSNIGHVKGEVYSVNKNTLKMLDDFVNCVYVLSGY